MIDPSVARASVDIRNVTKSFSVDDREVHAIDDVSFSAVPGEFVSIVGPSGCGKSTLLRLIAGLEVADDGAVLVDGEEVSAPSRQRGIVFQDHRLFPWLTVEANIALGLLHIDLSPQAKRGATRQLIDLVGLAGFEGAYPRQLSGGMAQRAAIARSLAARPRILLLDEPFGALDALTRSRMQGELLRIWEHEGVTMILVTHDVAEAVHLSDRIVVMDRRPGRVREIVSVEASRPRSRRDPVALSLSAQLLDLLEGVSIA